MKNLDITQITDFLYISAYPSGNQYEKLIGLNIRLILSMFWLPVNRTLLKPPMRRLWLPTNDHPMFPMPIRTLNRGVMEAIPVIESGHAVLTHCKAGRHRSVAMACCVLISQGYTTEQAVSLVKERRPVADPEIWYILDRIKKFEQEWQNDLSSQRV